MTNPLKGQYCNSLTRYSRLKTREVKVGRIGIGGSNPIRIQSMTTTNTMDTEATINQSIRMIEAGCEYVRITAPSINEAENLQNIKDGLRSKGYNTPLIADIHFTPNAAVAAAQIVEKVRINPGNYADRKKFEKLEYSDQSYNEEIDRIRGRIEPLIATCLKYKTALRIGTNHGSLSDRIMSRYGDTPLGMVESAMEFLRICTELDYYDIILSMKASNPQVMVHAYRLLVTTMRQENMYFPLHLGVTEAGEGEDGRIKSAVGIGTLLEDGLGDTIRVSLTEEPELELPVARLLVDRYLKREHHSLIPDIQNFDINPFAYIKRASNVVHNIGGKNVPRVIADLSNVKTLEKSDLQSVGYTYLSNTDKWEISENACDFIAVGQLDVNFELPATLAIISPALSWNPKSGMFPIFSLAEFCNSNTKSAIMNFVIVTINDVMQDAFDRLSNDPTVVVVLESTNTHRMAEYRRIVIELMNKKIALPVIFRHDYKELATDKLRLYVAADFGGLLVDGWGDGIWLASKDLEIANSLSFGILQAARTRMSKTEYISCPSCGRTQFDLQETTAKIKARTMHLKGLKIGVMGCIVNGPGEMADADYGYVGTGPDTISLYKGREVVKKNISSDQAVDALIQLIKENTDWVDPSQ